ncbi:conjugation TrbI-like protein [Bordetella bronchiseptica F4563]|uniref:TrbI/VirB10 family protein n=1 Tax=Bordetella bronchiseptica TaxID=518 RepID=UPI000460F634|nr:TrbI/VirB10 family protein [Bordetella bronchiseptica]KDC32841.1 conjugation TrbI-like protein [Bordetella bronchiseptica F4563]
MSDAAATPEPTLPPKLPPETVELRAAPRRVTRLNRRTLVIGIGVVSLAVLGATLWSLQPRTRGTQANQELYNVDRITRAEGLESLPRDYSQVPQPETPPPVLGEPLPGDLGRPVLRAEREAGLHPHGGPDAAEVERLARLKESEEAARSALFYKSGNRGSSGAGVAPAPSIMSDGAFADVSADAGGPVDPMQAQNMQDNKVAFASQGRTATRSAHRMEAPRGPDTIMAGTVISAALVTGIKSDMPGDIIATVTEPVYDSATRNNVLIPQGARLMGRHNSQVAYGQSRAQAVWDRIVMPDTSSIVLDNLAAADPAGYAGLEDDVDWHWDRILAGAALTTLLGVGAELAAPQNQGRGNGVVIAARDGVQDTVNQVGQEITRRNLQIQPTITIRPGMPVRIVVNRDITLRPYRPLFINR